MAERNNDQELWSEGMDRISREIALEDQLAFASEGMEIGEILEEYFYLEGTYGEGYADGFRCGFLFRYHKEEARLKSISAKYNELHKKMGMPP